MEIKKTITLEQAYRKIPMEVRRKFVDTANYVLDNVVFNVWNESKMRNSWRKRSLDDIVKSREINHLFPCIDTAALATKYLIENGENASIKLLTEKGAVDAFRQERSRALHIDAITELVYEGVQYGLDIGCGDLTLFKPILEIEKYNEEETYLTTRPEPHERIWRRTPFLKIRGKNLIENSSKPTLDFMETKYNLISIPYGIKKIDFHTFPDIKGKKGFLTTNEDYDQKASASDNKKWLTKNQDFLPGLKEYKYI